MAKIKAYAIHQIQRRNDKNEPEVIPASSAGRPSVFDTTAEQFAKLEKLNAARRATPEEVAVAKDAAARAGNPMADDDETGLDANDGGAPASNAKPPASGAKGDPLGAPKKAAGSKSENSGDDDDMKV